MSYAELDMLIDGKWTKGSGAPMDVLNPATEEVLGQLPTATDADLDAACLLYTSPSPRDRG